MREIERKTNLTNEKYKIVCMEDEI